MVSCAMRFVDSGSAVRPFLPRTSRHREGGGRRRGQGARRVWRSAEGQDTSKVAISVCVCARALVCGAKLMGKELLPAPHCSTILVQPHAKHWLLWASALQQRLRAGAAAAITEP
jgi:hypothetical protein